VKFCLILQWYQVDLYPRPENREELFNLGHASARNVIEHIFGVVKRRWQILTGPPEFPMSTQAQIPPALAALHNFILQLDPFDLEEFHDDVIDPMPGQYRDRDFGQLAHSVANRAEKWQAENKRDHIAQKMWEDYQNLLYEVEGDGLEY
jgi:hypothetical protein